ncbi:MAG: hypothetical protein AAF824_10970 [Bacteroidota bacterium]
MVSNVAIRTNNLSLNGQSAVVSRPNNLEEVRQFLHHLSWEIDEEEQTELNFPSVILTKSSGAVMRIFLMVQDKRLFSIRYESQTLRGRVSVESFGFELEEILELLPAFFKGLHDELVDEIQAKAPYFPGIPMALLFGFFDTVLSLFMKAKSQSSDIIRPSKTYYIFQVHVWRNLHFLLPGLTLSLLPLLLMGFLAAIDKLDAGRYYGLWIAQALMAAIYWFTTYKIHRSYLRRDRFTRLFWEENFDEFILEKKLDLKHYKKSEVERVKLTRVRLKYFPWSNYSYVSLVFQDGKYIHMTCLLIDIYKILRALPHAHFDEKKRWVPFIR